MFSTLFSKFYAFEIIKQRERIIWNCCTVDAFPNLYIQRSAVVIHTHEDYQNLASSIMIVNVSVQLIRM
jgi:hypothetical protein